MTPRLFRKVNVTDNSDSLQILTTKTSEATPSPVLSQTDGNKSSERPRGRPRKYPLGSPKPSTYAKEGDIGTTKTATPINKLHAGARKDKTEREDLIAAGLQSFTFDSPITLVPVLATASSGVPFPTNSSFPGGLAMAAAPPGNLEVNRSTRSPEVSMKVAVEATLVTPMKRKRGRPKSVKSLHGDHETATTSSGPITPVLQKVAKSPREKQLLTPTLELNEKPALKRKRGRPKKADSEKARKRGRPSKKRQKKRSEQASRSTDARRPLTIDDVITETEEEEDDNEWQDIGTDDNDGAHNNGSKAEREEEKRRFVATCRLDPALNAAWSPVLNPLPGYIDVITCSEVVRPAISPFGHVLRYFLFFICQPSQLLDMA